MSEFEAKTSTQITKLVSEYYSGNDDVEEQFPAKKWVPFEAHQKLEIDFNNVSECANFLQHEKNRLEDENRQFQRIYG